jgi:hypothetical protein
MKLPDLNDCCGMQPNTKVEQVNFGVRLTIICPKCKRNENEIINHNDRPHFNQIMICEKKVVDKWNKIKR